jgi:hypothetical protein
MPTNIDQKELYSLIRESVKANTTNAESTKAMAEVMKKLENNMCQINDNFVLHNISQEDIKKDLAVVRKQLLKWLFMSILVIFTLLGGILIAKSLGLDIVELINK